jgi:hypothetical protein
MSDKQVTQFSPEGPPVFANWHAKLRGLEPICIYEYPLLTDARIIAEATQGYGPYKFLNPIALRDSPGLVRPGIILRFENFLPFTRPDFSQTDAEYYHGGELADEIAALVSLCLGIRLKAGGSTRRFDQTGDPWGSPTADYRPAPIITLKSQQLVLPNVVGVRSLIDLLPLQCIPLLSPEDLIAFIRAARLYQDALWISESEPALSWIMFVSAVEACARQWEASTSSPLERLKASKPDVTKRLYEVGGDSLVEEIANMIVDSLGATKNFIDFVLKHMPPPPDKRPPEFGQIAWSKTGMKKILQKVYSYRSKALHGGKPFPAPMCEPPSYLTEGGAPLEKPTVGSAIYMRGGTWMAKDVPILLHTFEYITRSALLEWLKNIEKPKNSMQATAKDDCCIDS